MLAAPRSKTKYQAIAEKIHADISAGKFSDRGQLPSYRSLTTRYGVAYLTVRRSVSLLVRKGIIQRAPRKGSFVADTTHRALVGLLSEASLFEETAHFYRALVRAIQAELHGRAFIGHVYDGRDDLKESDDWSHSLAFQRFVKDLNSHSFDGVIAISLPVGWTAPEVMRAQPCATFATWAGKVDVSTDYDAFGYESMRHLHRRGCRRIVCLRPVLPGGAADLAGIERAVRELEMPMPRIEQIDGVNPSSCSIEPWAHQKAEQLIAEWQRTRRWPDALWVSDDIATRGVALALVKHGVRVPGELAVLTLSNEGIDHHYGIPVIKYQYSLTAIAKRLVEVLETRMRNPKAKISPTVVTGTLYSEPQQ